MKKITLINLILLTISPVFSQEVKKDSLVKPPFNQWTMELSIGDSKGIDPYATGYYSNNPNKFLGTIKANSFSLGARYMISPKFGFKGDFSYSNLENSDGNGSLPFKMQVLGVAVQGVINVSKVLDLEKYINRFGLLAHAGIKGDQMTSKTKSTNNDHNYGVVEYAYGFVYGITPQYRLGDKLALQLDLSFQNNFRQHLNWDGSKSDPNNNLNGKLFTSSIGLTYSLGKENIHGDWAIIKEQNDTKNEEIENLKKHVADIETAMNDTDKDGVADYLDTENNSIGGAAVDTRGKMLDLNKNGVPDEIERKPKPTESSVNVNSDMVKKMINQDYFVINFDSGKTQPNKDSSDNLNNIFLLLKNNPDVSLYIIGYGDDKNATIKNEELSNSRALTIKNMLVKAGISEQRLVATNPMEGLIKQKEGENLNKNTKKVTFRLK